MSCLFRWTPYRADARMGLNHQMSSLSCAMNEASYLGRTLALPPAICTDSAHNLGESCPTFESLFDVKLLGRLLPLTVGGNSTDSEFTTIPKGCGSRCAKERFGCDRYPLLERRQSGFWFQACLQRAVDTDALARHTEELLGLPANSYTDETAPSLALLRSGLFYNRALKEVARRIRRLIGGPYSGVHLRRSDKLRAAGASQAATRDRATQAGTLLSVMQQWARPGDTLYIGSTEPASFFAPLNAAYRLLFSSNFSALLQPINNNYALYAVESLIFVGGDLYVETYGYTRGNYMRGCFPYQAPPKAARHRQAYVNMFGVAYGRACSRACHEELHLIPSPRQRCDRGEAP